VANSPVQIFDLAIVHAADAGLETGWRRTMVGEGKEEHRPEVEGATRRRKLARILCI
jgi:hypothetical protein